jgi:nucleotide-binding universal stress UspA family protein
MTTTLKPQWTKPATILFPVETPANERAFAFALAQAKESKAQLILFHVYDLLVVSSSETSGIRYYDYEAARKEAMKSIEPLAELARAAGVECRIEARLGFPSEQILTYAREHAIDRIVMGTRSPGHLGKLLVGSVAEAVLRSAEVPVYIVGPNTVDGAYRRYATRTVLCAVHRVASHSPAVALAAETARERGARLILAHVIVPHERRELADRTVEQVERELEKMIPAEYAKLESHALAAFGDPVEEILYHSRQQRADLIVLGAHEASALAAVSRNGVAYKVIAGAECPVLALPPAVIAAGTPAEEHGPPAEIFLAGVF